MRKTQLGCQRVLCGNNLPAEQDKAHMPIHVVLAAGSGGCGHSTPRRSACQRADDVDTRGLTSVAYSIQSEDGDTGSPSTWLRNTMAVLVPFANCATLRTCSVMNTFPTVGT